MAKTSETNVQDAIRMMFPDEAERLELLQSALVRLCPDPPKGDRLSAPVNVGEIVIEMLRIRRTRDLVQLIMALRPKEMSGAYAILGDLGDGSIVEVAYTFGVNEGTVGKWATDGMPVK